MRDLSLHILDLMQNSIQAQAKVVSLSVLLGEDGGELEKLALFTARALLCASPGEKPCGVCATCRDRAAAFRANGADDPALAGK